MREIFFPENIRELLQLFPELLTKFLSGKVQTDAVAEPPDHARGGGGMVQLDEVGRIRLKEGSDVTGDRFPSDPGNLILDKDDQRTLFKNLLESCVEVGKKSYPGDQELLKRLPDHCHTWIIADHDDTVHGTDHPFSEADNSLQGCNSTTAQQNKSITN